LVQIVRRTGPAKVVYEIPIEPVDYVHKELGKRIAIFDSETDPFLQGRIVKPFTCGFYLPDTGEYKDFWGDDCIDQFFQWLSENFSDQELCIFAHNGGNFDFYFFLKYFEPNHKPFIINGRLVQIMAGGQEFRDSFTMIPVGLGNYDKGEIDYRCFERGFRDIYKEEILIYQKRDCTSLAELVVSWFSMFGSKLTMASVALNMLRSYHGFETMGQSIDADMRPYYFGGRNECFETGEIIGNFKIYDINSSYPDVMKKYNHPISSCPRYERRITNKTHFAFIRARSHGALPIRNKDGSLSFPHGVFDFFACIHEIKAGLETGTLKILSVYHTIYFDNETNFGSFIDHFYSLRLEASENKDEINKLFYKLVMNSSYGKFAQDPRKFESWIFDPDEIPSPAYCDICHDIETNQLAPIECLTCKDKVTSPYGWYLHTMKEGKAIYAAPQRVRGSNFFNVATAASITSAARASLLKGISAATRPVYCDTDSIICYDLKEGEGIELHPSKLGAWDIEKEGDAVYIAGKKLYAVYQNGVEVKKASKGVKLTGEEIKRVCKGEIIEYANPVPKFSFTKETKFTTRRIRKTGDARKRHAQT
jgi:hypothetical protein